MAPTLYVKYGSRLTSGMAECFYDRVLADPDLAPFFEGSTSKSCASISPTSSRC